MTSYPVPAEAQQLERSMSSLLARIDAGAEIHTDDDAAAATAVLAEIAATKKQSETARKALVQPLNDHVKWINQQFKDRLAPALDAEAKLRKALLDHQKRKEAEAEQARLEAQAEAARRAEEAEAERRRAEMAASLAGDGPGLPAQSGLSDEIEEVPAALPPRAVTTVHTARGSASTRKVWKFTVNDKGQVPDEYLLVDEQKVRRTMRDQLAAKEDPHVPGIVFYQDSELSVRA